jgi:hypothetical protein
MLQYSKKFSTCLYLSDKMYSCTAQELVQLRGLGELLDPNKLKRFSILVREALQGWSSSPPSFVEAFCMRAVKRLSIEYW